MEQNVNSVASAQDVEPRLINQDKYVGIERSSWHPRDILPLSGFAVTLSGKSSPKSPEPASEIIALERQEFPEKTIFPEKFPVPVVCSEFCGKVGRCNLRGNGFDDLCKHHSKL